MIGRGARGRGQLFTRRGGRRAGDVRPSEEHRAPSTLGTGAQGGQRLADCRSDEANTLQQPIAMLSGYGQDLGDHGYITDTLMGSMSQINPVGPNGSPSRVPETNAAIGSDTVASYSPPLVGEHTNPSTSPQPDQIRRETESSVGPSSTGPRGSSNASTTGRGPYRGISLERSNRQRGCKLHVCMELCDGRPNQAAQASALASELGLAVREMISLFGDWRNIPMTAKRAAWSRVQARLDLSDITDDPMKFKKVIKRMGRLHKRYRYEVKKNYHENPETARPAHHTDNEDWKRITEQWDAELAEETLNANENNGKRTKAQKGRDARGEVRNPHRCGSKSFTTKRKEMSDSTGEPIDEIVCFKSTRYVEPREDGSGGWVGRSKETYNEMLARQQAALDAGIPVSTSDILDEVMRARSRSDYRPGRGYGPDAIGTSQQMRITVTQLHDALEASRTRERDVGAQLMQTRDELNATRTELAETRTQLTETRTELTETRTHLTETRTDLTETRVILAQQQAQLDEMASFIRSFASNFASSSGTAEDRLVNQSSIPSGGQAVQHNGDPHPSNAPPSA